jgi:hypothetical protein
LSFASSATPLRLIKSNSSAVFAGAGIGTLSGAGPEPETECETDEYRPEQV